MLRRYFWPLLTCAVLVIITLVCLPLLNGWASQTIVNQLEKSGSAWIASSQPYHWGYLHSEARLKLKQADGTTRDATIKISQWGLGPSAVVSVDGKPVLNSQWRWHPFSLSLSGKHHFLSQFELLQKVQMNTKLSLSKMTNHIALDSYQGDILNIAGFRLDSTAQNKSTDPSAHGETAQWQHKLQLGQFSYDDNHTQFTVKDVSGESEMVPGDPLSNYKTQVALEQLHWRSGGLPLDLNHGEAQIIMQAPDQAIKRLRDVYSQGQQWRQQLSPLFSNGLMIHIEPLKLSNKEGSLNLSGSLAINPTNIGHSALDGLLLMQNSSAEIHANSDIGFLESVFPDEFMVLFEQALRRGLITMKGSKVLVDLVYQRGELKHSKASTATQLK